MWDNQYVVWGGTKQLHIEKLVSNDLSRANQIVMTGPNSVVLFAQTLVCSLCNYYLEVWPQYK